MNRKLAVLLSLGLMLGITGCEQSGNSESTEVVESTVTGESDTGEDVEGQTEEVTEATTEGEEVVENSTLEDKVSITFGGKNDDRTNENGDTILYVYYSNPEVTISGNEEATKLIAQELDADEEAFFIDCDSMEAEAALVFEDDLMEDIPPYANEVRFTEKRVDDKVVSFEKNDYSSMGGAHGNTYRSGWNFDVETGKRLTIEDIAEDKDVFMENVKDYVLELCQTDAYNSRLFPEYESNIDYILQDDLWFFDYEGITFISNTYELAAYAQGVIYFTVPYTELEGLKDTYSYDGGFQKSVSVGETVTIDIDGDGSADEVKFDVEESSDYTYIPTLVINGATYSNVFDDNQCYFAYPYDRYVIMDIDDSDNFLEIAVQDYGMSDDPMTAFLRYDGSKVTYLGEIYDRVSDMYIVNDGKGTINARVRMNIFETIRMKTSYKVEDDKLTMCMADLYSIAYTDGGATKTLLQDLIVYQEMSTESETVTLAEGAEIVALATDNTEWVQIADEDGNIYYVHVVNYFMIDMNGNEVDSREVFDSVIQAG